jgi:integrase
LDGGEIARLTNALAVHKDRQVADIVRMLMLTGARRGEVLGARWDQFDLARGTWTKPASLTKQKAEHQVPLNAPARKLLSDLRRKAKSDAVFVFPSNRGESGHREDIKKNWAELCKAAKISGARIHDVRHTFASVLASRGLNLPVIGALLGHTQPSTTARYAHLFDDALRQATQRAADVLTGHKRTGKGGDNVHKLETAR